MVPTARALARRKARHQAVGMALIVVGFLVFMFGTVAAAVTEVVHPILVALAGFGIIVIGGFVMSLPEMVAPPAVKGAKAAGGTPVRLTCPNCGAAPSNVDRDGVVICDYCETRFVVP